MSNVSWGKASWIGLISAIIAALSPLVTNIPGTAGLIVGAALSGILVIGRQLQAAFGPAPVVDASGLLADPPSAPTDVPASDLTKAG